MVDTDTPIWYEIVTKYGGDHRTIQETVEQKFFNDIIIIQPKPKPKPHPARKARGPADRLAHDGQP